MTESNKQHDAMAAEALTIPAGYALVPIEPTPEILTAIWQNERDSRRAWERAIATVQQPAQADARQTDDEWWNQALRERDIYEEYADEMASAIANHLHIEIGEHSNFNNPWLKALEAIKNARQADARGGLTDALRRAREELSIVEWENDPPNRVVKLFDEIDALLAAHPGQPEPRAEVTEAARDVLAERRRQVEQEGWTPEHDDQYQHGSIAQAAGCYALHASGVYKGMYPSLWPWMPKWWKPTTPRRGLVKAGALILAEIERLDRAAARDGASS